jgi:nucleoside triphosphate pyrophosphatase
MGNTLNMLVLASRSPRRAELLANAGIPFVVRPADVDETLRPGESPVAYTRRIAEAKARAVEPGADEVVLGADTVVVIRGEILGKPTGAADAQRMLRLLSGRRHAVITAICLRRGGDVIVDRAETKVWFAALTTDEIHAYVASGEPLDKAGAYAIQGLASKFIWKIEGSYSNVVGLPVALLYKHLR